MKLVLTEAALGDLRSIRNYTLKTCGEQQEERHLKKLWSRIESLRAAPHCHRLREDLFPDCRLAAEGRHIILFRANPDTLKIVRVVHSAMDFKLHLPREDNE